MPPPNDDLPQLAGAIGEHLPEAIAVELGQLLLLQAPRLLDEHADRLSDVNPCIWLDDQWDGVHSHVALPAHHIIIQECLDRSTSLAEGVRVGHSERHRATIAPVERLCALQSA